MTGPKIVYDIAALGVGSDFPDGDTGGRALVTELTRDSITTMVQCDLEATESKSGLGAAPAPSRPPPPPPMRETGAGHAVVFGRR